MRKVHFQNGNYYHIYNRGVDKRKIFMDDKDYLRFLRSIKEFNNIEISGSLYRRNYLKRKGAKLPVGSLAPSIALVDIVCFILLPNHYHFLIKQTMNDGVMKFFHKLGGGYTNYFNFRYNRIGSLFQGPYNSVQITTNEYLFYVSAYINGNSEIHKIAKAEKWTWSSYQDYLSEEKEKFCAKQIILNQFNNVKEYKKYVDIVIKESSERKDDIKKYLLE